MAGKGKANGAFSTPYRPYPCRQQILSDTALDTVQALVSSLTALAKVKVTRWRGAHTKTTLGHLGDSF